MPLAVRTKQWRVHHLARSIPPNQRTPQTTCQSRSHDGQPGTFRQPKAFAYLLRFNDKKIDKSGTSRVVVGRRERAEIGRAGGEVGAMILRVDVSVHPRVDVTWGGAALS